MSRLCSVLSLLVLGTAGKHIAVTGGMMKSHHISVVPIIEGLLEKGHKVSFLMPNTTECKSYFPKGIGDASMVYLGTEEWNFETLFSGPEYDMKNLPWYKKPAMFAKVLSSYRSTFRVPLFSMNDELVEWLKTPGVDAIVSHMASFGSKPIIERSGIPWVSYMSVPPLPFIAVQDKDIQCRYPNQLQPPALKDLKSSFVVRLKNHMACRFLHAYMAIANHEFSALFETQGLGYGDRGFLEYITDVPLAILLGGPPVSLNVPLWHKKAHVLGIVDKPKPHPLPADMLSWLDAAVDAGAPVVYISMGTKYELQEKTCTQLLALLNELTAKFNVRFLWSLRASQQATLASLLPEQGLAMRIEKFTPQPEVLQHPAVRVFLSHCGWGGVTDSIAAGVPVLGYPGMSDQFQNAMSLQDAGAGLILSEDFSNLVEAAQNLLASPSFAAASKAAGEALHSYGGLPRALALIEAAAEGSYLEPDAKIQATVNAIDPFFETPQVLEKWVAFGICLALILLVLLVCCCCCRCFCRCCCGRGPKPANVDRAKKQQ